MSLPAAFKSATVIPLYKGKGSRKSANCYRPIVILNAFCKIFERFVFSRLYTRIESSLIPEQHVYRKAKSCNTATSIFTQYVYDNIDVRNGKVGALFIDFKGAFNTISHEKVINKLMFKYRLDPFYIRAIYEIMSDRRFKFFNDTKYYSTETGCGQGSVLSSLLFSIHLNDIKSVIDLPFLAYADDILIYTHGVDVDEIVSKLENCFQKICNWCDENSMIVNFSKTKYMIFSKQSNASCIPSKNLIVNNNVIERVEMFKYLGLFLDPQLSFELHYQHVLKNVTSRVKLIHGIRRYLSKQAFCVLVSAYVHSVMDYCIDVWCVQTKTKLSAIQSKVNNLLISYFYPFFAKLKSSKRDCKISVKRSINEFDILNDCNFLTLSERCDLAILKNLFVKCRNDSVEFTSRSKNCSMPKIVTIAHFSETYKKSLVFRGRQLWNNLPKEWVFSNMSISGFCSKVKDFLKSKRDSEFVI